MREITSAVQQYRMLMRGKTDKTLLSQDQLDSKRSPRRFRSAQETVRDKVSRVAKQLDSYYYEDFSGGFPYQDTKLLIKNLSVDEVLNYVSDEDLLTLLKKVDLDDD